MKRRGICRSAVLILTFFIINLFACGFPLIGSAHSADLLSSYNILKNQYPEYISRIVAGGANEEQIQSFLIDLDASVRLKGVLDEANFNQVMYESLQEVITSRKHRTVFRAMLTEFDEEISYTLENHSLHPNLIPLRNAVRDSVLGVGTNPPGQSDQPGGNSNKGEPLDSLSQSIQEQLAVAGGTITVSTSSNTISLNGELLQQIKSSGRNLEITADTVKFLIPPNAINVATTMTVTFSARTLDRTAASNLAPGQLLLGSVYDLNCSTEASVSGLNLQQPVTVTLSYSTANTADINEDLLDVYYYDESKKTWTPMKGTVDKDKNTITFTTTHFSKYAIMTKPEAKDNAHSPVPPTESTKPSIPPATTDANKFTDLAGHWAAAEIDTAVKLGIVSGMSPTEFAPDRNITRAEFAALLTRALGLKNTANTLSRFTDVTTDTWYFNAVNSAATAGLVSGYTVSTFAPEECITREQMAVMISRALAYKNKQVNTSDSTLAKFKDRGQISSWAQQGSSIVVQLGIVTGRSADTFAPRQNSTRAEATAMILRMYKQL